MALVFIPLFLTLITLDQTRVFCCISYLPFLLYISRFLDLENKSMVLGYKSETVIKIGVPILFIFSPAIFYRGDNLRIWLPYENFFG